MKVKNNFAQTFNSPPCGKLFKSGSTIWLAAGADSGLYSLNGHMWLKTFNIFNRSMALRGIVENSNKEGLIAVDGPKNQTGIWEYKNKNQVGYSETERNQPIIGLDISRSGDLIVAYESGEIHTRRNGKWENLEPLPKQMINVLSIKFRENNDL